VLDEDLDAFLEEFGDDCTAGATAFRAIADQPDALLDVQRASVHSREYEITYRTDAVALVRDQAVTIVTGRAAGAYTVREAPRRLDDGAFSACLLSKV